MMSSPRLHYNNFNLVRLVAALQVLLVHGVNHFEYDAWFVGALKAVPGVPAFFFTSGFLIFSAYERMRAQNSTGFFVNRVLRIYPALVVCVVLSVLMVYATGYFDGRQVGAVRFVAWILGQVTVFQFYNPPFMRQFGVGVLNGALWTITVELQFYALVPFLYYLLKHRTRSLAVIFVISLLINVATNLYLREEQHWDIVGVKLLRVSFLPHLYMFLLGFMTASSGAVRAFARRIKLRYLVVAYVVSMNVVGPYEFNASNAINPISFALLALTIVKVSTMTLPVPARVSLFVERTDFSYGLYLYHMPILNLLLVLTLFSKLTNIGLLVALSFLAAALSWYLVERPALRHKR